MAYEFQKLGEVEALAEVPDGANALIEVDGDIKRVPGSNLGGGGGVKTLIVKSSDYDSTLAGIATQEASTGITYTANMTFEETLAIIQSGEPLTVWLLSVAASEPFPVMSQATMVAVESAEAISCFGFTRDVLGLTYIMLEPSGISSNRSIPK